MGGSQEYAGDFLTTRLTPPFCPYMEWPSVRGMVTVASSSRPMTGGIQGSEEQVCDLVSWSVTVVTTGLTWSEWTVLYTTVVTFRLYYNK